MSLSIFKKKVLVYGVVTALYLAVCASASVPQAFADAYLDALKDAANEVTVDPMSRKRDAANASAVDDEAPVSAAVGSVRRGEIPSHLDIDGLEKYLKDGFVGSYTFFSRLPTERKQLVFQAYKARPDITHIRDEIRKQYLQR